MSSEAHIRDQLEQPGVGTARVVLIAVGLMVFLFASVACLALIYRSVVPPQPLRPPQTFPEPRIGVDQPGELQKYLSAQRQRLEGYRWVDKKKSLISIPIERAMQIIAARGADAYKPIAGDNGRDQTSGGARQ
jgi:hypothetical protein